ncbi:unnamed protein product [Effrenium voratum]|uniref:Uncharacterized protein n=1 Tax=Effrenium voratum TaxID=2562239 RepID=A0AA36MYP8_9DINO|nr:unnamed protein product [Effrenium voratum]
MVRVELSFNLQLKPSFCLLLGGFQSSSLLGPSCAMEVSVVGTIGPAESPKSTSLCKVCDSGHCAELAVGRILKTFCQRRAAQDAALSDARCASVARPGIARSQNRVLPFRGMAQQMRAQRLSQISSHGSWTVWAGFARRGRPSACVTDASSVYSKEFRTWL